MLDVVKPYSTRFEIKFINDNKHIGNCSLVMKDNIVDLWNFSIQSSFRGLGLGKQFLSEVIEFVSKSSFSQIGLFVDKNNEAAYHIYKKFEFKEVELEDTEEELMFYNLNMVYMKREV